MDEIQELAERLISEHLADACEMVRARKARKPTDLELADYIVSASGLPLSQVGERRMLRELLADMLSIRRTDTD